MANEHRAKVLVCVECKEAGEANAPRSCIGCRVAMCVHAWDALHVAAAQLPERECRFHEVVALNGNFLDI